MKFQAIAQYLTRAQVLADSGREIQGFSIDSRKLEAGDLFFALKGDRVDGHQFVKAALQKGAAGAIIASQPDDLDLSTLNGAGLILVPHVLKAMQDLALALRRKASIPVFAITGSNGKTTTKDLMAQVLATKFETLKTQGNYNNEIGLPLTLLELIKPYEVAVVEMGMRGLGQIAQLAQIAQPDYGIITNIGTAHFELLGSQEKILQAKGELLDNLPSQGVALLNRDDYWSYELSKELTKSRPSLTLYYYGFHPQSDFRAREKEHLGNGTGFVVEAFGQIVGKAFLSLKGRHNVQNALAALAAGHLLDIPWEQSLASLGQVEISQGRLTPVRGINGSYLLDDTYNANPISMIASLEVLTHHLGNRRIAVLGTMGELGSLAREGHQQVGETVASLNLDFLLTVGQEGRWIGEEALANGMAPSRITHCQNNEEAIQVLMALVQEDDIVLIKGSRALAMETIVMALAEKERGDSQK